MKTSTIACFSFLDLSKISPMAYISFMRTTTFIAISSPRIVKPLPASNHEVVFSLKTETWKLANFGISRVGTTTSLSPTEDRRGTPCYAAPEVLLASKFNKKTDIWALGCVGLAYEVCTGSKAFKSNWAVTEHARSEDPSASLVPFGKDSVQQNSMYAKRLNDLVLSMLVVDASDRSDIRTVCKKVYRAIQLHPNLSFVLPSQTADSVYFFRGWELIGKAMPIWTCIPPSSIKY